MAYVFGYNATDAGTWDGGSASLEIAGLKADNILAINWNVTYSQNLQPMHVIGSTKVVWTRSHQAGTFTVQRILSDANVIEQWGEACAGKDVTITASNGKCNGSAAGAPAGAGATRTLTLKSAKLQQVSWSGQAEQAYVSEDITAQFTALEIN